MEQEIGREKQNMKYDNYKFRLKTCVWEITLACCFSCKYCGSRAGKARENELTTEECLSIVRQLADMGCRRVSLIGGEVFMRSDWAIIVKALTDLGVNVSIITNGFLFSDKLILELKRVKIESVAISLDGTEDIHDLFRQKGSFRRAIQAIDILNQGGIPVSIISTLHKHNIDCLEELYKILKEKNIVAWQLQACSPMGNALKADFSAVIDFRNVISFVEKHSQESHFAIGIADNIGYYTETEGYLRGDISGKGFFLGCRAGLSAIGIDSVGNVRGCESMYDDSFVEGNLRETSLHDIWYHPNAFAYNRQFTVNQLSGRCKGCSYGRICAGGCRSYNYFTHGKLYESLCCIHGMQKAKPV